MQDRRRHPRLPSRVRVWVACPTRTLFTRAVDESSGGLGFQMPAGFARGDRVKLTISADGDEIERRAVVAWVEGPRFGLRFLGD